MWDDDLTGGVLGDFGDGFFGNFGNGGLRFAMVVENEGLWRVIVDVRST